MSSPIPFERTSTILSMDQQQQRLQEESLGAPGRSTSAAMPPPSTSPASSNAPHSCLSLDTSRTPVSEAERGQPNAPSESSASGVLRTPSKSPTSFASTPSSANGNSSSCGSSSVTRYSRDIEQVTGYVSGEFECMYGKSMNGKLYAGSKGLYFLGSYFLFEKKVVLPWEDIRKVEKIDQGIQVVMKDSGLHTFTGMHAPDRVWVLLVSLHNDALLDRHPQSQRRGSSVTRSSVRRRNSDPLMASTIRMLDDTIDDEDKAGAIEVAPASALSSSINHDKSNNINGNGMRASFVDEGFFMLSPGVAQSLDIHIIERNTGKLSIMPIQCNHNKVKGKLYAGRAALYFYGRRFFWDQQEVLITWEEIRHIHIIDSKNDQGERICVGLQVTRRGSDGAQQVLRFLGMERADQVWVTLVALHNDNLTARKSLAAHQPLSNTMRRMNSDPNLTASASDAEDFTEPTRPKKVQRLDDAKDWVDLVKKSSFSNHVVKDHVVHCTMDEFFDTFVKNGAEHSISRFLESRGDSKLRETTWKLTDEPNQYSRFVNYTHPVNAPLAPPVANARKEQEYRRFKDCGVCIWTKTFVDDVPMADCFYVSDRVRVEPRGKGSVVVNMEFEITFVKSTMFKSIISKTTTSEFTNILQAWASFMSRALGEAPAALVVEPVAEKTESRPWFNLKMLFSLANKESLTANAGKLLLLFVLLVQLWIITELRGLQQAVRELQFNGTCPAPSIR